MRAALLLVPMLGLATGCGDGGPEAAATQLLWDPAGGELGVFPDDAFTVADAAARTGLRLDMPPERFPVLAPLPDTFRAIFSDLSSLDGFGVTAGSFLRFDGPLDPASLWSGEATADPAAPIVLAVRTGAGLTPWPYEAHLTDEGATVILEPMAPLPPASEAVLLVTDRLLDAAGRPVGGNAHMRAALRGQDDGAAPAPVAARMAAAAADAVGLGAVASADELAAAIVFTTQSLYEDDEVIAADIAGRAVTASPGITCTGEPLWVRCEGSFTAIDYRGGDGFVDDLGAGRPVDDGESYELPFTVWLPLVREEGEPFPTLLYGHGLGGGRDQAARLAQFAAPHGLATIAIDALAHGDHPTSMSQSSLGRVLDFFGMSTADLSFQPFLMREHFRQSAWDKLQLVRLLEGGLDVDGDGSTDLDADRIVYLGVSLGGIMGPELLALAPRVRAAVLIVPGGRVSTIVRDAEQFSLLIDLLRPDEATDGDVERFFPILQTVIERGDAAVWAAHLLDDDDQRPAGLPAAAPHLLVGMVIDDDTVPNSSNRALARALRIPAVPPVLQEVGLVGVTAAAPIAGNWPDGRTAGLLQFDRVPDGDGGVEPATHGNIADSEVGLEAWFRFIDGYLADGSPVIIDPYAELGL